MNKILVNISADLSEYWSAVVQEWNDTKPARHILYVVWTVMLIAAIAFYVRGNNGEIFWQ